MKTVRFVHYFLRLFFPLIARVEIEGLENVPPEGEKVVLAANHLGRLDSVLIYYTLKRGDVIMPTAEKYRDHPIFAPLVKMVGSFFIDRHNPDIAAVREVLRRMARGQALVIAPEGTRSKTEALQPGHPGVVYFASKSGAPIIPAAVIGTEDRLVKERLRRFRRLDIHVRLGEPFTLPPLPKKDRDAALQAATEEVMCRIAALLPPRYRGVYADHPRLRELLEEGYGQRKTA